MLDLSDYWLKQLSAFDTLVVGLSGGLDSMVLLHMLKRHQALREKLLAVHVHHGLSPHADEWLLHCQMYCESHQITFAAEYITLDGAANLEAKARAARYRVFSNYVSSKQHCLVLAHHQNDQAETVLLNVCRGAGVDGLSAMPDTRLFSEGMLFRPLLTYSQDEIKAYANQNALSHIEDESNASLVFSRNFLRHEVLPLLQKKWPNVISALSQTAKHCQAARQTIEAQAYTVSEMCLSLSELYRLPRFQMIHAVRAWLKSFDLNPASHVLDKLLDEVIFAKQDATPCMRVGEYILRRYQHALYLDKFTTEIQETRAVLWHNFSSEPLSFGHYLVKATPSPFGICLQPYQTLTVRTRQGGERIKVKGQTKSVKKLFQSLGIAPWIRDKLPLVFIEDELVLIPGVAIHDAYYQEAAACSQTCYTISAHIKEDSYEPVSEFAR